MPRRSVRALSPVVVLLPFSISIIAAYHNKTLCVLECVANGTWFMSLRLVVTNYLLYVTDLIYSVETLKPVDTKLNFLQ